jgi:pyrroline-5-carboxylate reductase
MKKDISIAILGAGNMGEAIIRAMINKVLNPERIIVFDKKKERISEVKQNYNIVTSASNIDAVKRANVVIIAVKPQDIKIVLEEIKPAVSGKILISIAAGVRVNKIIKVLGKGTKLVRAMPNICALNSDSATGLFFSGEFSEEEISLVKELMEFFGKVVIVSDESHLDVVTGLSGSGPAFVFVFLEALTDAGVKMGIPRKEAKILALQTVLGSAKLAMESGKHFAELKDMVSSPGGTTMAGLKVLEDRKFRSAIMSAVESATKRAKELAK